jgi:hypothetical protein
MRCQRYCRWRRYAVFECPLVWYLFSYSFLKKVESEAGFKKDYETLTAREKEDLLTQLLMDVTLHNQGDVITVPTHAGADSPTMNTDISYISDTKYSKSHETAESYYHSMKTPTSEKAKSTLTSNKSTRSSTSGKSVRSGPRVKSISSSKSLRSLASRTTSVCTLPPIVPKDTMSSESKNAVSLSSSHSGLSVLINDPEIGLNGIDIEIDDDPFYIGNKVTSCLFEKSACTSLQTANYWHLREVCTSLNEDCFNTSLNHIFTIILISDDVEIGLEREALETRSFRSEKTSPEQSLIDALHIQEGEVIHQLTEETKSLKSLGSSHGMVRRSRRTDDTDGVVGGGSEIADGDLGHGEGLGEDAGDGILGSDGIPGDGGYDIVGDGVHGDDDGDYGQTYSDGSDGNGPSITITVDTKDTDTDGQSDNQLGLVPPTELQAPHMSLSSLQDEVRLVATEVLSRPKSGRTLVEDAEMATFLLMERMQGLLDPALAGEMRFIPSKLGLPGVNVPCLISFIFV